MLCAFCHHYACIESYKLQAFIVVNLKFPIINLQMNYFKHTSLQAVKIENFFLKAINPSQLN